METLTNLVLYVGIAAVFVVIFGGKRWFRRAQGNRDLGEEVKRGEEQRVVDALAGIGSGANAKQSLGRVTYKASIGLRIIGPVLVVIALYRFLKLETASVQNDAFADAPKVDFSPLLNADPMILLFLGLMLWYSLFIWGYEIDIDGTELSHTGWFLNRKRFDLAQLRAVEETRQGLYVLMFDDGRKTELLKYVRGAKDLKSRLLSVVEARKTS